MLFPLPGMLFPTPFPLCRLAPGWPSGVSEAAFATRLTICHNVYRLSPHAHTGDREFLPWLPSIWNRAQHGEAPGRPALKE